ncbi:MAG: Extracellular solute-binding protein family 5 [Parcubacteria group bacterium GW2011_GWA2_36_10]|nr:MAG: Extracellular solute-binding protein family 5 [Parcubacteria group bacterium GW2011_GWA2_36_10]
MNLKKIPSLNQLKQLPKVLDKREKTRFRVACALLIIGLAGIFSAWYTKNSVLAADYGGSYTEGLIGTPNFINPAFATSDVDRDLVKLVFSGLMNTDNNGVLVPDLASGYAIDAEQKIYTFELRNDVKWHDDMPLTADDVVFTVERIKNPEYKSPLRSNFNGVTVNKLDDYKVQFILDKPFAAFLSILTIGILPEHLWYSIPDFGAELAELNKKPIGCGPYKFTTLTKDSNGNVKNYILKSNHKYYLGRPYIDELTLKFYSDFEVAAEALQNKNVDGLMYLPKSYKEEMKNHSVVFKNLQSPQYTALFFNPQQNGLLNDIKFRRVLALAIDKNKILQEALNNDGQIIQGPILPGSLGFDANVKDLDYDLEAAKKELEALGWTLKEGSNYRQKSEQELTLKLTTIEQEENIKAVNLIKEAWENLGIKVELDIIAKAKVRQDIIEPRNYQVLLYGQIINVNAGPYPFWHSSQITAPGLNLSIFSNSDIDKTLEKLRNSNNDLEKADYLNTFEKKLLEQHLAIFLYNPTYTYPVAKKLKGLDELKFINLPADRLASISTWFLKTKRSLAK